MSDEINNIDDSAIDNNDPEFKGFLAGQNNSNWMDIGLAIIKSKIGFPGPTSHLSANYITTGTTGGPLYNNLVNYIEGTEMAPALVQSHQEDLKNMVDRGSTFTIRMLHTLFPGKLKKSDEKVIRNVIEACGNNLGAAMPILQQSLGLDKEQSSFLFNAIFGEEGSRRAFATSAAGTLKPLVGAGYANKFLKTMMDAEMGEGAYKRDEHFGRAPSEVAEIMKVMAERGQLRIKQSDFSIQDNEKRMGRMLGANQDVGLDEDLKAAMAKQRESQVQSNIQSTASYGDAALVELMDKFKTDAEEINKQTKAINLSDLLQTSTNEKIKKIGKDNTTNFNAMQALQEAGIDWNKDNLATNLSISTAPSDTGIKALETLKTKVSDITNNFHKDTGNLNNYLGSPDSVAVRQYTKATTEVTKMLKSQGIEKAEENAKAAVKANAIQNTIRQINSFSNESVAPLDINTTKNTADSIQELRNRKDDFTAKQSEKNKTMINQLFTNAEALLTDFGDTMGENGEKKKSEQELYKELNTTLSTQARKAIKNEQEIYKNYILADQNKKNSQSYNSAAHDAGEGLREKNPTAFKEMQEAYANSYAFDRATTNIHAAEESATMLMTAFEQSGQEITAEQAATVLYNIVGDAKQQDPDEIISKVNEFTQNMKKSGRTGAQTLAAVVRDATVAKQYGLSGNSNARTAIMTASMLGAVSGQENQLSATEKEAVSNSLAEGTARATQDIGIRGLGLMKYLSEQSGFGSVTVAEEEQALIDKIKNNKTESITAKEFEKLPALAQKIGKKLGYTETNTASFMNSNRALDNVDASALIARGTQLSMLNNVATVGSVGARFKGISEQEHVQLAQAMIGRATDIEAAFKSENTATRATTLDAIKEDIMATLDNNGNTAAATAISGLKDNQLNNFFFQAVTDMSNDASNQQKSLGQLESEYKIDPTTIAANKQINEAKNRLRRKLKETSKGNMTQLFDTLTSKDGDIVKAIGAISNIQDLTPIINDTSTEAGEGGLESLAAAKVLTKAELEGDNSDIWKAIKNGMDVTKLIKGEYATSEDSTEKSIQTSFTAAKQAVEEEFKKAVKAKEQSIKEDQLSATLKSSEPAQEPAVTAATTTTAETPVAAATSEIAKETASTSSAAPSASVAQTTVATAPETTSVPVAEGSGEPIVQLTQKVTELNTNVEKVVAALNSGKAINVRIVDATSGEQPGTTASV